MRVWKGAGRGGARHSTHGPRPRSRALAEHCGFQLSAHAASFGAKRGAEARTCCVAPPRRFVVPQAGTPARAHRGSREKVKCGGRGGTSLQSDREEQPEGSAGRSLRARGLGWTPHLQGCAQGKCQPRLHPSPAGHTAGLRLVPVWPPQGSGAHVPSPRLVLEGPSGARKARTTA